MQRNKQVCLANSVHDAHDILIHHLVYMCVHVYVDNIMQTTDNILV